MNNFAARTSVLNIFSLMLIGLMIAFGISSCGDNTSGPETKSKEASPITRDQAINSLIAVLKDRGLTLSSISYSARKDKTLAGSANLTYNDYLTTEVNKDGERIIYFNIGPDGHIIPSGAWRDAHPNVCKAQNRYMKGSLKQLRLKLFHFSDGYDVFAQYVDVKTGKIEKQQEGQADSGQGALKEAINKAMDKLQVDIKPPTGPCGRLMGFKFVFDSKIKAIRPEVTVVERVTAEFNLTVLKDQEKGYGGKGSLRWLTIEPAGSFCSVPDGTLSADKLIFPQGNGANAKDVNLALSYKIMQGTCKGGAAYPPIWMPEWVVLHEDEIGKDRKIFYIKDWKSVPGNDAILARKVYDRSQTITGDDGESINVVEKTTIEIRNGSTSK